MNRLNEKAKTYCRQAFPDGSVPFADSDPELAELFANFAFDEVAAQGNLDVKTRHLAILATLLGCGGADAYRERMLPAALVAGVTPVEVKETLYQAVAYLGIGRVYPFFAATNEMFERLGIVQPTAPRARTTSETRLTAGEETQIAIFGEGMRGFATSGDPATRHINRWLVDNCFGDYYTRDGLDHRQREMITFCFLAAQGGCEPQLTSHATANFNVGNDKSFLIDVVSQCLPYIGYPRSLNALQCVRNAAAKLEK